MTSIRTRERSGTVLYWYCLVISGAALAFAIWQMILGFGAADSSQNGHFAFAILAVPVSIGFGFLAWLMLRTRSRLANRSPDPMEGD